MWEPELLDGVLPFRDADVHNGRCVCWPPVSLGPPVCSVVARLVELKSRDRRVLSFFSRHMHVLSPGTNGTGKNG